MAVNRRRFFEVSAQGAVMGALGAVPAAAAKPRPAARKPVKLRIGHQMQGILSERDAAWLGRFGVNGVGASAVIADPQRIFATVDELKRTREIAERHGLTYDIAECALPTLNVDQQEHPAINLGMSPQRDRDIESFQNLIRPHLRQCHQPGRLQPAGAG